MIRGPLASAKTSSHVRRPTAVRRPSFPKKKETRCPLTILANKRDCPNAMPLETVWSTERYLDYFFAPDVDQEWLREFFAFDINIAQAKQDNRTRRTNTIDGMVTRCGHGWAGPLTSSVSTTT